MFLGSVAGKEEYFTIYSVWYYSDENLKVSTVQFDGQLKDFFESYDEGLIKYKLMTGWNLITINKRMIGKNLDDFKGNCNLERVVFWNADSQEWKEDKGNTNIEFEERTIAGAGLAVKVSDECEFVFSEKNSSPPPLPSSDSDVVVTQESQLSSPIVIKKLDSSGNVYLKNIKSQPIVLNSIGIFQNGIEYCLKESNGRELIVSENAVSSFKVNSCDLNSDEIYTVVVVTSDGIFSKDILST
jgi:hypothetical protein